MATTRNSAAVYVSGLLLGLAGAVAIALSSAAAVTLSGGDDTHWSTTNSTVILADGGDEEECVPGTPLPNGEICGAETDDTHW